jgi:hypothetical protein
MDGPARFVLTSLTDEGCNGCKDLGTMPSLDTALVVVAGIALFAAFVNGAIGYGFSSLTVPLALVF